MTFAELQARFDHWRHENPKTEAVIFFFGGFCFDLLMLHRIDSAPMLIHQGSYLAMLAALVVLDHRLTVHPVDEAKLKPWIAKAIGFRHGFIHFLFGTLLNAFIVFYFRAASGLWAFAFLLALASVLILNELPRFRALGPVMRYPLWSFALTSYLAYVFPTMSGHIEPGHFYLAVALSGVLSLLLFRIAKTVIHDPTWTFPRGALPAIGVQVALLLLYLIHVLPPVPLATKWIGIAYDVERQGAKYRLLHRTPLWKVWENGDQTFRARKGDKVYLFAKIFAPKGFKDGLHVRWERDDASRGWVTSDVIPLTIFGGEHEWRGFAYKRNWQPGDWRVTVETDDARAVGDVRFTLVADESTGERTFIERWE